MRALIGTGIVAAVALSLATMHALAGDEKATGAPAEPQAAALEKHIMLTAEEVKWGDPPPVFRAGVRFALVEGDPKAPGRLFAFRLKFPDGYKVAPHFHPADEHLLVIAGTLNMGLGDKFDQKTTSALPVGGFAVMPKGQHHFAWAKGETVVQVYAVGPWGLTYVNPADDPRNQKM